MIYLYMCVILVPRLIPSFSVLHTYCPQVHSQLFSVSYCPQAHCPQAHSHLSVFHTESWEWVWESKLHDERLTVVPQASVVVAYKRGGEERGHLDLAA